MNVVSKGAPEADILSPDFYVQIPAYRDNELFPTLRSLYAQAAKPGRLRVRVMWQRKVHVDLPIDVQGLPGLEVEEVDAASSEGCNWARRRLQRAWRGERYTLFIDSHHRFVAGWDDLALEMLEESRGENSTKPVLTGYLPGYDPASGYRRTRRPLRLYPYARDQGVLTRLKGEIMTDFERLVKPAPADFVSLHFLLADGSFNNDVPFNPAIYFFGDEVLTSVRAFAAGYRLFHPQRVVGWHAYNRDSRVTHWVDHDGYEARHEHSLAELRRTYRGERDISSAEVAAFEDHVNLSLVID
ncbi:GlcNAc-transferase family protein [Arthrobacter globiformis]|uniref:GlcNAc-transferase family protein n=1 Tax=Arthrobacter globiformis TaxID=1665 RepID=UPI00397CD773